MHSIIIDQAHKTGIIAREVVSKNMYFVDRENYTTYIHLLLFNGFVYVCLV